MFFVCIIVILKVLFQHQVNLVKQPVILTTIRWFLELDSEILVVEMLTRRTEVVMQTSGDSGSFPWEGGWQTLDTHLHKLTQASELYMY